MEKPVLLLGVFSSLVKSMRDSPSSYLPASCCPVPQLVYLWDVFPHNVYLQDSFIVEIVSPQIIKNSVVDMGFCHFNVSRGEGLLSQPCVGIGSDVTTWMGAKVPYWDLSGYEFFNTHLLVSGPKLKLSIVPYIYRYRLLINQFVIISPI